MPKKNDCLRFVCPHCRIEHVTVGLDVDQVQTFLCPGCGGFCDVFSMKKSELRNWLRTYFEAEG